MAHVGEVLGVLFSLGALASLLAGTVTGLVIGTIPGIGPAAGIGLLVPLVFVLPHTDALLFYVSIYQAAEYGGSITAISISIPGAPNSAAVIADGYAMNRRGQVGKALAYSLWSVIASSMCAIAIILLFGTEIANVALHLGAPVYVMLGILGLATVGAVGERDPVKGIMSAALGVALSTIGLDAITGAPRFMFGIENLSDGIPLLPLLIGLFAVPEVFKLLYGHRATETIRGQKTSSQRVWLNWHEIRTVARSAGLGTVVGLLLGIIPGLAGVVASFVSYNTAKLVSRRPERFGTGIPEGIAAPEATNGAVMHSTLIPAFFLGIPGTPTSAVILGAMTIMGLRPGPTFVQTQSVLFYTIFLGLAIAGVFLFVLGTVTTTAWARIAELDRRILGAIVLIFCITGSIASGGGSFDVTVMAIVGLLATAAEATGFSRPAIVMGFLVGGVIENNLQRTLIISHGSLLPLVSSPTGACLTLLTAAIIILGVVRNRAMDSFPMRLNHVWPWSPRRKGRRQAGDK